MSDRLLFRLTVAAFVFMCVSLLVLAAVVIFKLWQVFV